MAQRVRSYPAGVPVHVVHRGVNRDAVFADDIDRDRFLSELQRFAVHHDVQVHAYVLMENHYHLLLTPCLDGAVSRLVRDVCRHYVPRHNARCERRGTLWDGRHWSTSITFDRQLLACCRYIELNPVRAGIVRHPGAYRWSSHAANAFDRPAALLTPHAAMCALARGDGDWREAYAALFAPEIIDSPLVSVEARQFRERLSQQPRQEPAGVLPVS